MLRAIREIQPTYVVGENVFGLINWNGGMVFNEVQADLEAEGYEVWAYVLPACAINAPHRRDRIWFVAYRNSNGLHNGNCQHEVNTSEGREYALNDIEHICSNGVATNPDSRRQSSEEHGQKESEWVAETGVSNNWQNFPTEPAVCGRDDGLSPELSGITVSKHRNESIKAYGNSVVPQVVFQIFKAIEAMNATFK